MNTTSTLMTVQTAPRDLQQLVDRKKYQLKRLVESIVDKYDANFFGETPRDRDVAKQAFISSEPVVQAERLLEWLIRFDNSSGTAIAKSTSNPQTPVVKEAPISVREVESQPVTTPPKREPRTRKEANPTPVKEPVTTVTSPVVAAPAHSHEYHELQKTMDASFEAIKKLTGFVGTELRDAIVTQNKVVETHHVTLHEMLTAIKVIESRQTLMVGILLMVAEAVGVDSSEMVPEASARAEELLGN